MSREHRCLAVRFVLQANYFRSDLDHMEEVRHIPQNTWRTVNFLLDKLPKEVFVCVET